jgi:hypothetical protein
MIRPDESCSTCRFWNRRCVVVVEKGSAGEEPIRESECRRWPPLPDCVNKTYRDRVSCGFPLVQDHLWCGEWSEEDV